MAEPSNSISLEEYNLYVDGCINAVYELTKGNILLTAQLKFANANNVTKDERIAELEAELYKLRNKQSKTPAKNTT